LQDRGIDAATHSNALQDRGIDAASAAALEDKNINPTDIQHKPGMLAAAVALFAIIKSPIGNKGYVNGPVPGSNITATVAALTAAGIDPWDGEHQPGQTVFVCLCTSVYVLVCVCV